MYEYTGTSGHPWRDMISEKPPLIWWNEIVSSSQSGARMAMNQREMDAAMARA
jgi:hypothetical protein